MSSQPSKPRRLDSDEVERLAQPLTTRLEAKPRGPSLCYRCSRSTIYRRGSSFDDTIWCNHLDKHMPHDIIECSGYASPTELSLYDMSLMAHLINDRDEPTGPYR